MTQSFRQSFRRMDRRDLWPGLILGAGLIATLAVYWVGLHGGFTYDDFPNIVHNPAVHIADSSWQNWLAAAHGSPSSLARPLAMLSFAVNYYFTGLDPFWFKLVNLALHLLCGVLVFGLLRGALELWREHDERVPPVFNGNSAVPFPSVFAAIIASAWLLAPINFTPVLYVVQRMAIIAQVFVLAGLWAYVTGRARQMAGQRGWPWLVLGLFVLPFCGLGGKETAILTPAYALALELTVFNFRLAGPRPDRRLITFFCVIIAVPLGYFIYCRLPGLTDGSAYADQVFTLGERLLTEARVLVHYIGWTTLPSPGDFGFYHNNIQLSTGLFSPWTTAASLIFLAILVGFAFAIRRRLPLIALGILWFFAGHILTATVIPLDLIYEHRNYFPSLGLLLAAGAVLLQLSRMTVLRLPAFVLLAALVIWPGGVTAMRSVNWSNPVRFAINVALKHPHSAGAQYALGRQLLIVADGDKKLLDRGRRALIKAKNSPNSGILALTTLITMAGRTSEPLNPDWYLQVEKRLHHKPIQPAGINGLAKLVHCQITGPCQSVPQAMLSIFIAALEARPHEPILLASYSQFAFFELDDPKLAKRMAHASIKHARFPDRQQEALSNILTFEPVSGPIRPNLFGNK